jgi:hypothetical protein
VASGTTAELRRAVNAGSADLEQVFLSLTEAA